MSANRSGNKKTEQPVFSPGDEVDHFRVIRLIGRGGMGEVYLARDLQLGRKVALKVIRSSVPRTSQEIERLLFEARTTARFNHPHIVTVYAAGQHRGFPYVALEYIDGQSLRDRSKEGQLALKEIIRIAHAATQALHEAHRHGVLHRDLKPDNVLLPKDGRVRVVDFGLADVVAAPGGLTPGDSANSVEETAPILDEVPGRKEGGVVGTPAYMSPEQWLSRECTPATDVWALGVMLYELLVGRRPFSGKSLVALATVVAGPEPAPSLHGVGGVPAELADLVGACLEKEADKRPTVKDLLKQLHHQLTEDRALPRRPKNPFRGLRTFQEKHAALFFGRDEEVDAFVERLREDVVCPVVGPSGAGKSSFVQAGVIPRLREQGSLMVVQLRPGSAPFFALAGKVLSLASLAGEEPSLVNSTMGMGTSTADLDEGPAAASSPVAAQNAPDLQQKLKKSPQYLSLLLERMATKLNSQIVLFVDQLEELYTMVDDAEEQRAFLDVICQAADDPDAPVRVIFTVREDFLSRLAGGPAVRTALRGVTLIRPPEEAAMEEILVQPVRALGYRYEDDELVAEMVEAAGREQASLPVLQFTAHMLWDKRDRKKKLLTRQAYQSFGGVPGALAHHADGVLAGLMDDDVELVREILLRLVTPEGTRRVVSWQRAVAGLARRAEEVLGRLVHSRLISVRKGKGDDRSRTELELVHESLIRTWTRLARWIDQSRDDLAFLYEVEQAAELWERRGRRLEEVWQGDALTDASRAMSRCGRTVPHQVVQFIESGQRKAQWSQRRKWVVLAAAATLSLLVMLVLAYQRNQAQEKEIQARQEKAAALREGARSALGRGNLLEARAKLRESLETQSTPLGRALWWRLKQNPLVWHKKLNLPVYDAAFSSDGKTVAVASNDRTVRLFNVATKAHWVLASYPDQVFSVAFSPNGKLLAAGMWSGHIVVRDLDSDTVQTFAEFSQKVTDLAFSPDSGRLAAVAKDGRVSILDLVGKGRGRALRMDSGQAFSVAFAPDGKRIAFGGSDRKVWLWNMDKEANPAVLGTHGATVMRVRFSPDGQYLASAGQDTNILVWDVAHRRVFAKLADHTGYVSDLDFDHEGTYLASASQDRTVKVWKWKEKKCYRTFAGHESFVASVDFERRGRYLVSSSINTVRVWDMRDKEERRIERGHRAIVYGNGFSPDGKLLATAGGDHLVRFWDVQNGTLHSTLSGHTRRVRAVLFTPDNRYFVSSGSDGMIRLLFRGISGRTWALGGHWGDVQGLSTNAAGNLLASAGFDWWVRIWDLNAGVQLRSFRAHKGEVLDVAMSPDGKLVASGGVDRAVRVLDVATGAKVATLTGHQGPVTGVAFNRDGTLVASTSRDKTVRIWNLADGSHRVVGPRGIRGYYLDFHPTKNLLGVPLSDGTAVLLKTDGTVVHRLRGHRAEVNCLRFSYDGAMVATSSDDQTARIWYTDSGRPHWRAPVMLSSPPRVLTHTGWVGFDAEGAKKPASSAWIRALETRASRASEGAGGKTLCLLTYDRRLELWNTADDRRLFVKTIKRPEQVLATPDGCLVRWHDGQVVHFGQNGSRVEVTDGASAVAWHDGKVLVAGRGRVRVMSPDGKTEADHKVGERPTTVARVGKRMAVGYDNGGIALVRSGADAIAGGITFEDTPSSPVVSLLAGPPGTLIAGFANGLLGIWSLDNGVRLDHSRLHGAIIHLLHRDTKLYAASELGDHLVLDLSAFYADYCTLMRQVWDKVPVVWKNGRPTVKKPPADHRCSKK